MTEAPTERRDLLAVIDDLTRTTWEHVAQPIRKRDGKLEWKMRTVEVPPVLYQFRDRVSPSGEQKPGSTSAKHTRSPGDLDALYEYSLMVSAIASWCVQAKLRPTRDPVTDILAWYSHVKAILTVEQYDFRRRQALGWLITIRNHLDPPNRFVPMVLCPVCGGKEWGDAINGGDTWPIEVRYRIDDDNHRSDEKARCRICSTVWVGFDAIDELGRECAEKDNPAA